MIMEKAEDLVLKVDPDDMNSAYLNSLFQLGLGEFKKKMKYIFSNNHLNPLAWSIGTWSVQTARSEIKKYGTIEDVNQLPAANN